MKAPIKTAIVGTGAISKEHLKFLSGQTQQEADVSEQIELAAICDLSQAAAGYHTKTYGAASSYTDYATMLEEIRPDVVHVLTPPTTHIPLSTMALESGAHVICEKPITPTYKELQSLLEVAKANDRMIMESHNYLFNDEIVEILSAIDQNKIGEVKAVEIRIALDVTNPKGRFGDPNLPNPIHKMPAGVIHDFTTHFTYLLLALSQQANFETVKAVWMNQSGNKTFRLDSLDSILVGTNETGIVHGRIRFDPATSPDMFSVIVRGSDGYIETDLFQPFIKLVTERAGAQLSPIVNHLVNGMSLTKYGFKNFGQKLMQKSPYHGLYRMLNTTYTNLLNDKEFPVTPQQILQASKLTDQLLSEVDPT